MKEITRLKDMENAEKKLRKVAELYLEEIATLIYYEAPFEAQAQWLEDMIQLGYFTPQDEVDL
tara:strand:- start:1309 stop:1497 length:189 start_codon:yes stop_codon:yes gene_type:complete